MVKQDISTPAAPEEKAVIKAPVFVVKNIIQKKKNPQQKLERYFAVLKSKRAEVAPLKNHQGFPTALCKHEEEIGKLVFCPPNYGDKSKKLCRDCLLRPCVAMEKKTRILSFCEEMLLLENKPMEEIGEMLGVEAVSIMEEIFGSDCVHKVCLSTACINNLAQSYLQARTGTSVVDEEGTDDDLIAQSLDGHLFAGHHTA